LFRGWRITASEIGIWHASFKVVFLKPFKYQRISFVSVGLQMGAGDIGAFENIPVTILLL